MSRRDWAVGLVAIGFLASYFLWMAGSSLWSYFSRDDMMNICKAWHEPLWKLVGANFVFFTGFYRPLGSAWCRVIYFFAGFNPMPFHAALLVVLFGNMFLSYAAARRLSGSREIGLIATLLVCYHAGASGLYYDHGNIYDVLCYFFYMAALVWYLRCRQSGRLLGRNQLLVLFALHVCALNAKEMAVTLPVLLWVYEWIYGGLPREAWGKWLRDEGRGGLLTGASVLPYVPVKLLVAGPLMVHPWYRPVLTLERYLHSSRNHVNDLFYARDWFDTQHVLLLWGLMLAIALVSRSKTLRFAWCMLLIAPLPVNFLPGRGLTAIYIALFGWALYFAALLSGASEFLLRKALPSPGYWTACAKSALLVLAVTSVIAPWHNFVRPYGIYSVTAASGQVRSIAEPLRRRYPSMPRGARILFLNDPFKAEERWQIVFVARLLYDDRKMIVDRLKGAFEKPTAKQLASYDYILDFRDGEVIEVRGPNRSTGVGRVGISRASCG